MQGWQTLDCLDMWPGDEVWHVEWQRRTAYTTSGPRYSLSLIGNVNAQGVFVCHLGQMH